MCDNVRGDVKLGHCNSAQQFENTNVEEVMPVYEEITTMKTEVIEEFCDYGTLDGAESEDVKPFSTLRYFQSSKEECPGISPYEQILKKDCYERHIVWCKEETDFGFDKEDDAAKIKKKYACDKCSYVTKSRPCFLRHVLIHGKRQLKCETCGRLFKRKDMLEKHGKVHCKQRQYVCDICSYVTKSRPHFRRHALIHGDKKEFKCETCGNSFRQKDDLKKHAKIHDNERQKEVCCPHCNKTYYTNIALQRHIEIKHTYEVHKCELCDYTTSYKYFLKRHELIKHSGGDKLYKCMYCEHSTHYKMILESSEDTNSNLTLLKCLSKRLSKQEKSCDCDPCQFETAYISSLRRHVLAKHSANAERHTCTVCTYSTHFEEYLKRHILRTHANKESPNKYKCEYCDHTTHCKENLKKHTLIHTNEKTFKCTYITCKCVQQLDRGEQKTCNCKACGFETVHRSALKSHVLTKHSGEAKKHICTYCGYSAHFKGHLEKHVLRKHANATAIPSVTS